MIRLSAKRLIGMVLLTCTVISFLGCGLIRVPEDVAYMAEADIVNMDESLKYSPATKCSC